MEEILSNVALILAIISLIINAKNLTCLSEQEKKYDEEFKRFLVELEKEKQ